MADSLFRLFGLIDDEDESDLEPRPLHNQGGGVASSRKSTKPRNSLNKTETQNLKGLINNTGHAEGNGNGSIIFGGFDSSTTYTSVKRRN
ncbi:hypothetical protein HN51_002568 [Arachis hypogaea]|uniref:Uncharacterized protein LOC127740959 n=1 Tax=Arachis duranensis TaxID=130453 RepID=A0A9C6WNI0_ARADU|nr:uncharacterized protein LOC127740959 [Arachis duranensis]XP_057727005.1 uncharacterized protein LOC130942675 [Arachis stenosperma]